jgi:hypothetical protein
MKHQALRGLRAVFSLIIVAATGGGQGGELGLVVQQIGVIGPRQWLGLMAGSFVAGAPVIAPLTEQIASSPSRRSGLAALSGTRATSTT